MFQVSQMGAGAQLFGPNSAAFLGTLAGTRIGSGSARSQTGPYGMPASEVVALCIMYSNSPKPYFLK